MRMSVGFLALSIAMGLAGCGKDSRIVPVSGRVTMDGQPLAEAHLSFQPVGDWHNPYPGPASYGVTDSDGNYTLTLMDSGRPGAVVGKHRITITPKESAVTSSDAGYYRELPPAQQPQTVQFEVPPGGTQSANFELKSQ